MPDAPHTLAGGTTGGHTHGGRGVDQVDDPDTPPSRVIPLTGASGGSVLPGGTTGGHHTYRGGLAGGTTGGHHTHRLLGGTTGGHHTYRGGLAGGTTGGHHTHRG